MNLHYPYFKGLEADRYSFYRVPKALVKADLFQKMSGDAKLLYAVLLDRMSLSIKNGWQDKHGNAYIICTIDEIMDSIRCARQKAVKLLDELELAYAVTIHKSQGSEYPAVVIPLLSGPRMLMNRNLLYTAVTRAKKCVTIVGDDTTFEQMIENNSQQRRYSGLKDRLLENKEEA